MPRTPQRKYTPSVPSDEFIRRRRNPDMRIPWRFERTEKEPGSLELVKGKWVEVE